MDYTYNNGYPFAYSVAIIFLGGSEGGFCAESNYGKASLQPPGRSGLKAHLRWPILQRCHDPCLPANIMRILSKR